MSEHFSKSLGGIFQKPGWTPKPWVGFSKSLGGIFHNPGWNFPQPWVELSASPPSLASQEARFIPIEARPKWGHKLFLLEPGPSFLCILNVFRKKDWKSSVFPDINQPLSLLLVIFSKQSINKVHKVPDGYKSLSKDMSIGVQKAYTHYELVQMWSDVYVYHTLHLEFEC